MRNRTQIVAVWALAGVLGAAAPAPLPGEKEELTFRVQTDRKRYDPDDTVMILARFAGDPGAKLQFSDDGGGALHFFLIRESPGGKGTVHCAPVWELQFEPWAEKRGEPQLWLARVDTGSTRQFAVHLPRLIGLPKGEHKLRIGYSLSEKKLLPLIESATGKKVSIPGLATPRLRGAFPGAVLSDPVTITIGPPKKQ